MYCVTLIKKHQ